MSVYLLWRHTRVTGASSSAQTKIVHGDKSYQLKDQDNYLRIFSSEPTHSCLFWNGLASIKSTLHRWSPNTRALGRSQNLQNYKCVNITNWNLLVELFERPPADSACCTQQSFQTGLYSGIHNHLRLKYSLRQPLRTELLELQFANAQVSSGRRECCLTISWQKGLLVRRQKASNYVQTPWLQIAKLCNITSQLLTNKTLPVCILCPTAWDEERSQKDSLLNATFGSLIYVHLMCTIIHQTLCPWILYIVKWWSNFVINWLKTMW